MAALTYELTSHALTKINGTENPTAHTTWYFATHTSSFLSTIVPSKDSAKIPNRQMLQLTKGNQLLRKRRENIFKSVWVTTLFWLKKINLFPLPWCTVGGKQTRYSSTPLNDQDDWPPLQKTTLVAWILRSCPNTCNHLTHCPKARITQQTHSTKHQTLWGVHPGRI